MKKISLLICILLVSTFSFADVTVYYDPTSKEVEFVIEDDERIRLSEEDKDRLTKKVLPGEIIDYGLVERYEDYKILGDRFIVNTQKISDRVNRPILEQQAREAAEVLKAQKLADRIIQQETAKIKLMDLGLTELEFQSLIE